MLMRGVVIQALAVGARMMGDNNGPGFRLVPPPIRYGRGGGDDAPYIARPQQFYQIHHGKVIRQIVAILPHKGGAHGAAFIGTANVEFTPDGSAKKQFLPVEFPIRAANIEQAFSNCAAPTGCFLSRVTPP